MIFTHCPSVLQAFLAPPRRVLGRARFAHLWSMLAAGLLSARPGKVLHLAGRPARRHRTRLGAFLGSAGWDAADLLEVQALRLLRRLRPRRGEALDLLIDGTRVAKRGKKVDHLSKLGDHKQQRFVRGHLIVTAAWLCRGVVIPWRFVLWRPKATAGGRYRKTTEIAADLVRDLPEVPGLRVRVLFDAFYLSPAVTGACRERGFTWSSVAASNRAARPAGGPRRKLADWAPGLLRHRGQRVRLRRARGWAWLRIASRVAHLSRIGDVRLVVSKRPTDPWRKAVVVATNEVRLSGRAALAEYEKRWAIEVLFKELRGSLGLGDYPVLSERKTSNHLHLCGLARQPLTHHGLTAGGEPAKPKASGGRTQRPMSKRLEALRADLRRERIRTLVGRVRHAKLRRKLEQALLELAPAA